MLPKNWVTSEKKGHHLSRITSYALFYQIAWIEVTLSRKQCAVHLFCNCEKGSAVLIEQTFYFCPIQSDNKFFKISQAFCLYSWFAEPLSFSFGALALRTEHFGKLWFILSKLQTVYLEAAV